DLEAALVAQPEIRDSAVIGIDTPQGPEPLAVLIMNDETADPAAVVARANQQLAQHQRLRRWAIWPEPEFPLTPTKKIRKPLVLERLGVGCRGPEKRFLVSGSLVSGSRTRSEEPETRNPLPTPDTRHPSPGFILQQVARVSGEAVEQVEASANLAADLKLDSLGRVELLSALEDHYQVDLDEAAITAATTVGDI